jgi:hypothetical protein
MIKPYQISAERVIIIPDWHQDKNFIVQALEKERGNYDHIITLGDEFDSHKSTKEVVGIKETARFVLELQSGLYGKITQLIGNHNLGYMESWSANQKYSHKRHLFNSCSGFTNSKSIEINKILKWENWRKFQLFCEFGEFLISHAGLHPSFWNFYKTKEENLDSLWDEADDALRSISIKPSRLFGCGQARGGQLSYGGPCWLDEIEMEEAGNHSEIPPQICGHSSYDLPRKIGQNYILDCGQTVYALLDKDGNLEIKQVNGKEAEILNGTSGKYSG